MRVENDNCSNVDSSSDNCTYAMDEIPKETLKKMLDSLEKFDLDME